MSDDYKYPGDSDEIWKNTSKWRPVQLEILKVKFQDENIENMINDYNVNDLEFYPDVERILLPDINVNETNNEENLSRQQKIFFRRLKQLNYFSDEPPIDSITYDILTNIGFEENKLHFRMKPHLNLLWQSHKIGSEPDFGVFINLGPMQSEFLLVVEDKPEKAYSYQSGECQLFGEMLVAASNNYSNIRKNYKLFGVIIKGTNVRFYNTVFTKSYLSSIDNDKIPNEFIKINRYPSEETLGLSLNLYRERELIIKILTNIKKELENI
ncbi:hypothetical protein HDV06_001133 [Boothiomyces sp. JEL0866]|nr:hypothetical protein HDV06_001133 [Boothiomyces sp. JEL0866]